MAPPRIATAPLRLSYCLKRKIFVDSGYQQRRAFRCRKQFVAMVKHRFLEAPVENTINAARDLFVVATNDRHEEFARNDNGPQRIRAISRQLTVAVFYCRFAGST